MRIHGLDKEAEQQLHHLDRQVVTHILEGRYDTMRRAYQALPAVADFLEQVQQDIVHNYKDFLPRETAPLPIPGLEPWRQDMTRFLVNLSSWSRSARKRRAA